VAVVVAVVSMATVVVAVVVEAVLFTTALLLWYPELPTQLQLETVEPEPKAVWVMVLL
jgi:hypothetical protein